MTTAAKKNSPKLSDFLCFSIYSANLALNKAYKPILSKLGVTYPQYITIISLWEQDNQSVSELGEKLFLESNTLTPLLKKLEGMGFVERQRDSKDERQVKVHLTDKGRRLREQGMKMSLSQTTGLTESEINKLQKTVARVRDNILRSVKDL